MKFSELKQLVYKGEKVDVECKKATGGFPKSIYETYSSFANTNGGTIILGVDEDTSKIDPKERYKFIGVNDPNRLIDSFWQTMHGKKVSSNILIDENVFSVEDSESGKRFVVITVPRAGHNFKPVYVGENPYNGTYKRKHEGDYHATPFEVDAMIRDKYADGNDGTILEGYTMDDIDLDTLKDYRQEFAVKNASHVWNRLNDQDFLERLGGYRKDKREHVEGLTMAGLLMFGKGMEIQNRYGNLSMDYRDESDATDEMRWSDRIIYDGTWENNLYNFLTITINKVTRELPKPFKLEGMQTVVDTSFHKAIREACVNTIIHADMLIEGGAIKIVKKEDGFEFSNPGSLKLPVEYIYRGGISLPRNPRIQTMLRMIGYGDNAGSGFPAIIKACEEIGWDKPLLTENTLLDIVTLKITKSRSAEQERFEDAELRNGEDSVTIEKILAYLETPKTRKEIQDFCGIKARRYFNESILNPLIQSGKVKLTIPEKPNSRLQKYVVSKNDKM